MQKPLRVELPQKKKRPNSPRIFTNTEENLLRSIERLARWTLRADVCRDQVVKIRAATGLLRLRVELARLQFDRERWQKEVEIEERLRAIECELEGSGDEKAAY